MLDGGCLGLVWARVDAVKAFAMSKLGLVVVVQMDRRRWILDSFWRQRWQVADGLNGLDGGKREELKGIPIFLAWETFFAHFLNIHGPQPTIFSTFFTQFSFPGLMSLIFFLIFIYLAASGLSCGTWDIRCGMRDLSLWRSGSSLQCAGFSLVVVCGLQGAQAQ